MKVHILLPIVTALIFPMMSYGLGFRITDQGAAATARGNAFVATADDPSAVYYNPAGITQLEGQSVLMGGYGISIKERIDPKVGDSFSNKSSSALQGIPQLYYTFSPHGYPLSLGLGINAPYGFKLEYPEDSPIRTASIGGSIKYVTINPVAAYQLTPTLSVGLGATINYAQAELKRGIFSSGDEFKFEGDDVAYGFNAGVLWKPHPMHSFGVSYHSATHMDFSGHSSLRTNAFTVPTPYGPFKVPGINQTEDASAEINFPQNVIIGYSFRPTPAWNFEIDADWTDWDNLNTVYLNSKSGSTPLPFNWTSSIIIDLGATHYFENGFKVSAGYVYSENSVPTASFSPTVPDSDRHVFSLGIGQKYHQLTWDLAYQYAYGPARTINTNSVADGTYRFSSHALSLSFGYNF